MRHAKQAAAKSIGNPYVALAVDAESAAVESSGLEVLGLAGIRRGKTCEVVGAAIGNPNAVLRIDAEMKGCFERLARLCAVALADNPSLGPITLREINELFFRDTQRPNISVWSGDDALHHSELAIDSGTEGATFHAWGRETSSYRRKRSAVRGELGYVALPQRVLALPTHSPVVANPEITLTVEHSFTTCAKTSAVKFERQNPCTGGKVEVWHEWYRAHVFALRNRIQVIQ